MLEAGESDYTDEAGYRFERIVQERKSMDEEKLLAELHERNLTSCIATKEVVDEGATLKAVEAGELPQEVLADALKVTEVVMTANLREWRHFLSLRACGSTGKPHPQMLEVAVPLLKELRERVPVVFDDLEPMEWETVK